jgi:hypothetical protein
MAQVTSRSRQDKKSSVMVIPEGGRIPPQTPEMEEAVLGAAMLENEAARMVVDILRPEVFYSTAHQKIFAAIDELNKRDQPIDLLTVTQELKACLPHRADLKGCLCSQHRLSRAHRPSEIYTARADTGGNPDPEPGL